MLIIHQIKKKTIIIKVFKKYLILKKKFSEFSPHNNSKQNNININSNNLFNNKKYKTEDELEKENNNKMFSDEEKFKLENNFYNFIFKDINEFQIYTNKKSEKIERIIYYILLDIIYSFNYCIY